jgi:hypothetical protein
LEQRFLKFADVDAAKAEVIRLRAGYTKSKNWTLPQACWHLNAVMNYAMRPGPHAHVTPSPEMAQRLQILLQSGRLPISIQAPEAIVPPANPPESAIDDYLVTLEKFKNFKGEFGPHRLYGSIPHDDFVRLQLNHCAHHLGFLIPTTQN